MKANNKKPINNNKGFISGLNLVRGLIQSVDWGTLFVLFVWVCGVRFVCIMISLPLLKRSGYGFSFPEALGRSKNKKTINTLTINSFSMGWITRCS